MATDHSPSVGWYGKVPATGDFVSRRLSTRFIAVWDHWLQMGMTHIRQAWPDSWHRDYLEAPIWTALLPSGAGLPEMCLATIAPSVDSVGRQFPFCVFVTLFEHPLTLIASLPDFCSSLAKLTSGPVQESVSLAAFDRQLTLLVGDCIAQKGDLTPGADIAEVLGDAAVDLEAATLPMSAGALFPWPDLTRAFEPLGTTSYWWSRKSRDQPMIGFTHVGPLDRELFKMLFATNRKPEPLAGPSG